MSEIYEVAQAPYLAKAVIKTVLRPRSAKFNVTAKDETLAEDYISPVHWPLTITWLAMLSGVIALVIRWIAFPGDHTVLIVVGGWAVFNFLLMSVAYRAVAEKQQRRSSPRVTMDVPASMWLATDGAEPEPVPVHVIDASTSGVRLQLDSAQRSPVPLEQLKEQDIYFFPRFEDAPQLEAPVRATVMSVQTSTGGQTLGLLLDPEQDLKAQETVAFLIFGDSENWRSARAYSQGRKGMLAGFGYVLYLFATGFPQLVRDLMREPKRLAMVKDMPAPDQKPAHLLAFGVDLEEQARVLKATRDAHADALVAALNKTPLQKVDP